MSTTTPAMFMTWPILSFMADTGMNSAAILCRLVPGVTELLCVIFDAVSVPTQLLIAHASWEDAKE